MKIASKSNMQSQVGILLYSHKNELQGQSTGFLIGPDLVLTAAYNVYSFEQENNYLQNGPYYFIPGAHGKIKNHYRVIDCRYHQQYKNNKQKRENFYQFALLKLDKKVQNVSSFILGVDYSHKQSDEITLFGYDVNKMKTVSLLNIQKALKKKEFQLTAEQQQLSQNTYWKIWQKVFIEHRFQTQLGFGGGPIILHKFNQLLVIGIHLAERRKDSMKIGRLITQDLANSLIIWSKEMQSSSPIFKDMRLASQVMSEDQKKTNEQLHLIIDRYEKSSLQLRQQKEYYKQAYQKQKIKNDAVASIFEEFKDMKKLNILELMSKIDKINEKIFIYEHNIINNSISMISNNQEEESFLLSHILEDININEKPNKLQ